MELHLGARAALESDRGRGCAEGQDRYLALGERDDLAGDVPAPGLAGDELDPVGLARGIERHGDDVPDPEIAQTGLGPGRDTDVGLFPDRDLDVDVV